MNLSSLRPSWQQYKFQHSLEGFSSQSILELIEHQEEEASSIKAKRLLANVAMVVILMICCQGG